MTLREARNNYQEKQKVLYTALDDVALARSLYRATKWQPFETIYKWIQIHAWKKRETKDWKFYEDLKGRIDHYILHDEL